MTTAAPEREDTGTVTIEELDDAARAEAPPCQIFDLVFGRLQIDCNQPSVAVLRVRCPACGPKSIWVCQRHLSHTLAGRCVHCGCGRHVSVSGVS